MGGRGAKASKLAGLKVELNYAMMKAKEYGNVKGGGSLKTRERFLMWNDQVKKLQKQIAKEESKKKKSR